MSLLGRALLCAVVAASCAASCAADGPRFSVNYAPGFVKESAKVSVFGVFRDGRMNPEAWEDLGPSFAAALHKGACEIAVSNALRTSSAAVFAAIDGAARSEGITDELLEKLAPAAKGDSILVIVITGRPPKKAADVGTTTTTAAQMGRGGGGGMQGGQQGLPRGSATAVPPHLRADQGSLEISASLYSKKQRQSVAMVAMTYRGASEADAVARFAETLAAALPGATCEGWDADLHLDPEAL
ncbi:MAG TPA: hypothetical protein VLT33_51070, partial [Labilithrix sp.]|nr:hypothetical protein [Labilithrix sp.]